jgi:DNA polymerase-3 subunit beta
MEFVIDKANLVKELQTVTGVVEKRATLPILANLLLETENGGLQVGASDLEVTIRGTAQATVKQQGSVTLPAGKLHEIARSLPDAEVQFKLLERNQVAISCERVRYRISGQPRDEFPKFPELDASTGVELPVPLVRDMIERVAFAITTEDPRYALNGALVLLQKGKLSMVATDGHRLAFITSELDITPPGDEVRVIVPKKALHEVHKLTSDMGDDDTVTFGQVGKQVFFDVGGHRLTSTMLEGNFPRYENVMPDSCETGLSLPTHALADAVRRVSLLASDRYGRAVKLQLGDGKLEVSSETEMGEAHETLGVEYDGPDVQIGFNARYLLDFLNAVGTEAVRLELNPKGSGGDDTGAGDKPGQFRPEPSGHTDYRYVVMPMHL